MLDAHRRRAPPPASPKPPDAGEIDGTLQPTIDDPVVRLAVKARPVNDVEVHDVVPFLDHKGRDETMCPVEKRQPSQDICADRLEAAARVARPVLQDSTAQPVREP